MKYGQIRSAPGPGGGKLHHFMMIRNTRAVVRWIGSDSGCKPADITAESMSSLFY